MNDESIEQGMSELADGELPSEQAAELLLEVLNVPERRERLRQLLQLRQETAVFRERQPAVPLKLNLQPKPSRQPAALRLQFTTLLVAACVGGLLVLGGFFIHGLTHHESPMQKAVVHVAAADDASVRPEQMRQVAKVFALHESVAGPLSWYASDDQNIRLGSAQGEAAREPLIAVKLLLADERLGSTVRPLVIVCRDGVPAVIELPVGALRNERLRLFISAKKVNGKFDTQFAIAAVDDVKETTIASLTGQRTLDLAKSSLGELALGNQSVKIDAMAWHVDSVTP